MKKYNIPYSLIRYAVDNNLLDTLHYYYMMRVMFKNRVIYKFSYLKASQLLQISVGATHNHIKKMIKLGWVDLQQSGNLKIVGVNKLAKNDKEIIQVPIESNKKAQLFQFRYVIIHRNLANQRRRVDNNVEIVKRSRERFGKLTPKHVRYINKRGGIDELEKRTVNRLSLSNKKIGALFHRSQSTGKRYQYLMNKASLIKSKSFFDTLGKLDVKALAEVKKQSGCYYLIVDNGILKKRSANTIEPSIKIKGYTLELRHGLKSE